MPALAREGSRVDAGATDRVLSTSFFIALPPSEALPEVLSELSSALERLGITAELQPGGQIREGGAPIGAVAEFQPGERVRLRWNPAPWTTGAELEIEIGCIAVEGGSQVRWTVAGIDRMVGDGGAELAGWVSGAVLAPIALALTPARFGDWITDRRARRPSGRQSETIYGDPTFHWPNFLLILDRIRLTSSDRLLEVGCGGGAFLHRALESGCSACAVDHSPEMVRLARAANRDAIVAGRVRIVEAEADRLPVGDEEFTCVVSTGVFGFLPDPLAALHEMHRALAEGGRVAIFTGTAALRGTPACPEPMASRISFYSDEELADLATRAGFVDVRVEQPAMRPFAEAAKLPPDAVAFFESVGGAQLLLARKGPPPPDAA